MRSFEAISLGGTGVRGFALAAASDPEVWTKLTPAQQAWVIEAMGELASEIVKCPSLSPSITSLAACVQPWFNANTKFTKPNGSPLVLRTDGVFDQDTLDAVITLLGVTNPKAEPFPPSAPTSKKLSTGAMFGIGLAGTAVVGGIIYAVTRGSKARRRRS